MKKNYIPWIIGGALVLVLLAAVIKGRSGGTDDLPVIRAALVQRGEMEETLTASGTFYVKEEEPIISRVNSRVSQVLAEEGDQVAPGAVLMILDSSDLEEERQERLIALNQAELSVRQTLLNLRLEYRSQSLRLQQLKDKYAKDQRVHELGSISDEDLRLSRDSLTSAENSLQATQAQLNLICGLPSKAEPQLSEEGDEKILRNSPEVARQRHLLSLTEENIRRCTVTSGIRGVVARLPLTKGMGVSAGMELALIQNSNSLEAEIWVDEVDIGKIALGDRVNLESDSLIGQKIPGRIRSISPRVERLGNSLASRVKVGLEEERSDLRSGGSCHATIDTIARENTLTIPLEAVKPMAGDLVVYRMTEAGSGRYRLEEKSIITGLSTLDLMEVLEGLEEGDRVAVSHIDDLRNGMTVNLEMDS